jgi:hypothetical protein
MRIGIHALLTLTLCLAALPAAALPTAAGYTVSTIDAGAETTGGVVAVGDTLFVGVGSFGAPQSIVRIDSNGDITTLATDFGSIAGLTYDPINDRLIVGDNGLELSGVTGDTVYEIVNPFTNPGTPPTASILELAPSGSIAGVADVILDPTDPTGQTLLVSDSRFPALPAPQGGQLWSVDALAGTATVLQQGLGFGAGLATDGTTLFIGQADLVTFQGLVSTVLATSLSDTPSLLTSGLPGQFDLVLASDGMLLGTALDRIVEIDPLTGLAVDVATGFGFATGLDEENGVIYALDFGLNSVLRFTPIPEPSAGGLLAGGLLVLAAASKRGLEGSSSC